MPWKVTYYIEYFTAIIAGDLFFFFLKIFIFFSFEDSFSFEETMRVMERTYHDGEAHHQPNLSFACSILLNYVNQQEETF